MNDVEEKIYIDQAANLFRGVEAVGGRIKISDHRIIFTSHSINIQRGTTEILMDQISSIQKRNTLGFVPNGILLETVDGRQYKFVVWNRKKIIHFVENRIAG